MNPHINPEYVITLQGRQYCTYRGVLDCAHGMGLEGIRTRLIQVPGPDNDHVAIVEAEVRLKDGRVFADIADASPKNVNSRIASALIRMASTRAKGRALRDAVNIGEALVEELPDVDAEPPQPARPAPLRAPAAARPVSAPSRSPASAPEGDGEAAEDAAAPLVVRDAAPAPEAPTSAPAATAAAAPSAPVEMVCSDPDCGRTVTQGQHNFSVKTFGVALCPQCQRKRQAQGKTS
ncbi:MAG: hypothetical protein HY321_01870 [Armatimonadetes bacterium]|nr:hypothetical protein [Armatimonadota bacterium]